ncbi:MAG: VTT domain-containing protein, partial [Pseudomonadota bacterium]|nr:VTT domain-containing protein [Pseudomonadota bacterium]
GALAVFTAARSALGGGLRARTGPFVRRLQAGFQADAWSYMLILRLVPLFPFWLVNIVPAMLQVPTRVFVLTTAIGIVPGSFVFVGLGNGLGHILEAGDLLGLAVFAAPEVLMPLVLLAALSALPILYKRWRGAPGTGEK